MIREVDKTAPKKIWLCVSDEIDDANEEFPNDKEDVCWAGDDALTVSVEYIRADVHAAEVARLNKVLEEARERARLVHQTEATPLELYQSQYEMRQTLVVFPERAPELAAWLKENR